MGATITCLVFCGRLITIDRTPPVIDCPANINQTNDLTQFHARVLWKEPKCAHDNVDGEICRLNNIGGKPGWKYFEGTTRVGYTARDRAGNMGTCFFSITINVVRCTMPADTEGGYYKCKPSAEPRYGTVCTYGCNPGYRINGDVKTECNEDGVWSVAAPVCEKVKCPPVREVSHGFINCSDANSYQSKCVYTCESGYAIKPGATSVRTCAHNRRWAGPIPLCIDVERPTIERCPSNIFTYTNRSKISSNVSWTVPEAKDNSWNDGSFQDANLTQGLPPNSEFPTGITTITYSAVDVSGNEAFPCHFKIYVRRLTCPTLNSTKDLLVHCPDGYGFGASCKFSCFGTKQLVGTDVAECEVTGKGYIADWQWGPTLSPPRCEDRHCPELTPGDNSAMACDEWLYGRFCKMTCLAGSDVYRPEKQRLESLYVCKTNGVWDVPDPSLRLPHCTEMIPSRGTIAAEINYSSGDCCGETVQHLIRKRFIEIWFSTPQYGSTCLNNTDECYVDNVTVACGSACSENRRNKRNDGEAITTMHIEVSATHIVEHQSLSAEEIYTKIEQKLIEAILSATEFRVTGSGLEFDLTYTSYDMSNVKLSCNHGFSPANFGCVGCNIGYYKSPSGECQLCPQHTYQDRQGSMLCKPCPSGTGTIENGAASQERCIAQCAPGYFSESGVVPCSPCGIGSYTSSSGATYCHDCPMAKTTIAEGSSAFNMCSAFDLSFTSSSWSHAVIENVSVGFGNFSIAASVQEGEMPIEDTSIIIANIAYEANPDKNITVLTISTDRDGKLLVTALSLCLITLDPQQVNLSTGKWYHLYVSWVKHNTSTGILTVFSHGKRLEHKSCVVGDDPVSPQEDGTLILSLGSSHFVGLISDVNMWDTELDESTIIHLSSCADATLGNVVSWNDIPKHAVLTMVSMQIPSLCDDFDNCKSEPCLNGAECVDLLRDFDCLCPQGFEGLQCEINIDDCADNQCENNATCHDGVNSYTCLCSANYKGDFCDVEKVSGRWSEWGDWSSCSKSCGGGMQSRERLCNNPPPDPDGQPCDGMTTDNQTCNIQPCPVCSNLKPPQHGSIICLEDEFKIKNCTVHCETGYEFSNEPLDFYWCGPDTGHVWSFATDDNPKNQLPDCTAIQQPGKLQIIHAMTYPTLPCVPEALRVLGDLLKMKIEALPYLNDGVFAADVPSVYGCSAIRDKIQANITIYMLGDGDDEDGQLLIASLGDNVVSMKGLTDKVRNLEEAASSLVTATDEGYFTVTYQDTLHHVDGHYLSGEMNCPSGTTVVNFYCVPCSSGYFGDKNQLCARCPVGSFQQLPGSTRCLLCPSGFTTAGQGSKSDTDCDVETPWASATLDDTTTEISEVEIPQRNKDNAESDSAAAIALSVVILGVIFMVAGMNVAIINKCRSKKAVVLNQEKSYHLHGQKSA